MATSSSSDNNSSEFYVSPDRASHDNFEIEDVDCVKSGEIASHLERVNLFKHLNLTQRLDIADHFIIKVFKPGDHIVQVGQKPDSFLIVLKGNADVYEKGINGRTLNQISTITEGNYIGAVELFFNREHSTTVMANDYVSLVA